MGNEIQWHEDARGSAQEREPARHELTIRAASALFAALGVPRSPRSVQGFCKDGHIDCLRVKGPRGDQYFATRDSVERYATELKQIDEVGKRSTEDGFAREREPARDSAQEREPARGPIKPAMHDDAESDADKNSATQTLREENLNLRIDNRAKEQFINQLMQDRNSLMQAVQDANYRLGVAETRVRQLEAPRVEARDSAQERAGESGQEEDTSRSAGYVDAVEVARVVEDVPPPVAQNQSARRSIFRKMFWS
jgi:hypothetical protein